MRTVTLVCAAAVAFASVASAQTSYPRPEIRPFVGAYVPTGSQADVLKSGMIAGAQLGFEVNSNVSLLGTFGWVPVKNKYGVNDQNTNTYLYDVGLELARASKLTESWDLKPFLGAGLGGRTYDYAASTLSKGSFFGGYGSLGTEFQMGRSALRLELRDYITQFKAPTGTGNTSTSNDLTFNAGFALHLR